MSWPGGRARPAEPAKPRWHSAQDNLNQRLRLGPVENVTLHAAQVAHMTLYCFALMLPGSYEQGLLAFQYKSRVSLFGCDVRPHWGKLEGVLPCFSRLRSTRNAARGLSHGERSES